MLHSGLVEMPRMLSYDEIEEMADGVVMQLAQQPGMNYDKAYKVIDSHARIFDEALKHLNHNAAMEMQSNPINYMLKASK